MSIVTNDNDFPIAYCYNATKIEWNCNSESLRTSDAKNSSHNNTLKKTNNIENCEICTTPRRKRRRQLSTSSEESPESTSYSASPEISCSGPPATYKLFEIDGRFFIVKRPMTSRQQHRSQRCTDHDITVILDSDSDDPPMFENVKKSEQKKIESPVKIVESSNTTPRSQRRLSRSANSESSDSSPGYVARKSRSRRQEDASFRIKLRRSTEQSHYKIESSSNYEYRRSSRSSTAATRQWCGLDNCDEDHRVHKTLRSRKQSVQYHETFLAEDDANDSMEDYEEQSPQTKTSTLKTPNKRDIQKNNSVVTSSLEKLNIDDLEIINETGKPYKSDVDNIDDVGNKSPLKLRRRLMDKQGSETPQKQIKKFQETDTPRFARLRRQSRLSSCNYAVNPTDDANNKENKSDIDDDDDGIDSPGSNSSRGLRRKRLSATQESETPKKQSMKLGEAFTPRSIRTRTSSKAEYNSPEEREHYKLYDKKQNKSDNDNDVDEAEEHTGSRGLGRRRLSVKQGSKTPQKQIKILEESMTPKRTPRKTGVKKLEEVSTPKRTPRKNTMTSIAEEPKTPSSVMNKRISKALTPSVKTGSLTPSMTRRTANIDKPKTILEEARSRLHVSAVPKSLPCREEEFNDIFTFLQRKLLDKSAGCIYISGVPGTGKTATVNEVIRCLKKLVTKGDLENFDFIEINGMKLSEPRQAYVQILKQMNGQTATWEHAHQILHTRFTQSNAKRPMTLLLVDELDLLCNKRQDVVYNLLDWPAKANAHLVVITIANTMDLPERVLMGRVTSRLGLTRLTFQPYNFKQLQEIVMARLKDSDAFKSEAIQLVARKVAAVSGDARRALDICRRATEIAEFNSGKIVTMQDVNQALTEMIASAKVQAIKNCSEMEKIFLQAVCAEVTRTGVEEANFQNVYRQLEGLCSFEGLKVPNITQALSICSRLGANRLLLCEHSRIDIHQRILLNVSSDDIHFATQAIDVQ